MKSYLSLIPLSAKVRKRQNRMTILCIVIAVLLVTVIFSLSEMFLRMESDSMEARHGSWQLQLEDPTEAQLDSLQGRAGLLRTGVLKTFNFDGDAAGYLVENKKAVLYGAEESTLAQFSDSIPKGHFPQNDTEAMLTPNAADSLVRRWGIRSPCTPRRETTHLPFAASARRMPAIMQNRPIWWASI